MSHSELCMFATTERVTSGGSLNQAGPTLNQAGSIGPDLISARAASTRSGHSVSLRNQQATPTLLFAPTLSIVFPLPPTLLRIHHGLLALSRPRIMLLHPRHGLRLPGGALLCSSLPRDPGGCLSSHRLPVLPILLMPPLPHCLHSPIAAIDAR